MTSDPTRLFGAVEDACSGDSESGQAGNVVALQGHTNRLAALAYAKLGWHVFPVHEMRSDVCSCGKANCRDAGKHPRIADGHKGATSNRKTVEVWWRDHPRANIGLSCERSGIVAIDIDPRNGGDATFASLEVKHGAVRSNLIAQTGGGGRHLLFAASAGLKLPGQLGKGVDLKANGYIVLAPSNHQSGGAYTWRSGFGPFDADFDAIGLAPLPGWIRALATKANDAPAATDQVADLAFEELRDALTYVPNDGLEYEEWIAIGAAIHAQTGGSAAGAALFHDWSSEDGRYDPAKTNKSWRSFGKTLAGKPITALTILKKAREAGWRPTSDIDKKLGGDFAHARRFARDFGGTLRFIPQRNVWTFWNGVRWTTNRAKVAAEQAMAACAKATFVEASTALTAAHTDEADAPRLEATKAVYTDAKSFYKSFISRTNALKAAQTLPELQADAATFDSDPMLLGVRNGMLDLRTGALLPPDPARFISRIAGCASDPRAACPKFTAFLARVQPDPDMREFLRRAVGYTMTGLVDEEKLFFAHGIGRNGKSVFANILAALLGDYAVTIPPETLMRSHVASSEASRTITRLVGARLALLNETPTDALWDDGRVKMLASRERIAARELYREGFDFFPTHKLWIRGNAVPGAHDASDGFWRRMTAFGFSQQIAEADVIPDLDRRIIADELPGVLVWALGGCLDWQKTGLRIPAAMAVENRAYRDSTDHIGLWLADAAEIGPDFRVPIGEAYRRCQSALNLDPWSASNVDPSFALSRADDGERSPRRSWSGLRSRGECGAGCQPRCLKRQLSLPVSTMSQWWVRRSRSAVVILASPKTVGHSPKARLVVTMTEVRS